MPNMRDENEKICVFTYAKGFHDFSPMWASLLGYSKEELHSLKIEKILAQGSGAKILQAIQILPMSKDKVGEAKEAVEILSGSGKKIAGILSVEWASEEEMFYCSFKYCQEMSIDDSSLIYEFMPETSISGFIKLDEYNTIIAVNKAFESYFALNNIIGSKVEDFFSNTKFVDFIKNMEVAQDYFSFSVDNEKLIALINKKSGLTSVKIYNKNFLMNTFARNDFSSILNMKRIWSRFPMVLLIDSQGETIVDANPAASEFYGYPSDEFKGMPMANISMLPQDIIAQEMALAVSGKKTFFISRHRTASGQIRDVNFTTAIVGTDTKKLILAFVTDITRRKNLEKVIEEKNEVLTELNVKLSKLVQENREENKKKEEIYLRQSKLATVGEMVNSLANDWKEPLNMVALLVQDMEDADKFGELDEKYIQTMVKKVMGHLENIATSIDTCVNFFRVDNEEELFDVRAITVSVEKVLQKRFVEGNITVCHECSCGTPCTGIDEAGSCIGGFLDVLGKVNEFKHMVCNVLLNSIDAIKENRKKGILLDEDEGLIFISFKVEDKAISISFRDNGVGIDGNIISKIFDPYFTTKSNGMGIGLYITKQIVEKNMRGSISFENIRDGVTVTLNIPCAKNIVLNQ